MAVKNVTTLSSLSRKELLLWINGCLHSNFTTIESLANGAAYCQILHMTIPGCINIRKVKMNTNIQSECMTNFKLMQAAFVKYKITKCLSIPDLLKGKYTDHYQFTRWIHSFYLKNYAPAQSSNGEPVNLYDPVLARCGQVIGDGTKCSFNDAIDWVDMTTAKSLSAQSSKPIFLLIHKSWCGACKALKPDFAESTLIQGLSEHFIMVNTLDDDEPKGKEYSPDGAYIPRVLFIIDGAVRKDIYNTDGSPKYKYYYSSVPQIVKAMTIAMKQRSHVNNEEL